MNVLFFCSVDFCSAPRQPGHRWRRRVRISMSCTLYTVFVFLVFDLLCKRSCFCSSATTAAMRRARKKSTRKNNKRRPSPSAFRFVAGRRKCNAAAAANHLRRHIDIWIHSFSLAFDAEINFIGSQQIMLNEQKATDISQHTHHTHSILLVCILSLFTAQQLFAQSSMVNSLLFHSLLLFIAFVRLPTASAGSICLVSVRCVWWNGIGTHTSREREPERQIHGCAHTPFDRRNSACCCGVSALNCAIIRYSDRDSSVSSIQINCSYFLLCSFIPCVYSSYFYFITYLNSRVLSDWIIVRTTFTPLDENESFGGLRDKQLGLYSSADLLDVNSEKVSAW